MYDNYAVWRTDFVNPQHSYESKFDAKRVTSSQSCTAYRSIQDTSNFTLKKGASFNLIQGYRIYSLDEQTGTINPIAKHSGESGVISAEIPLERSGATLGFQNAYTGLAILVGAIVSVAF